SEGDAGRSGVITNDGTLSVTNTSVTNSSSGPAIANGGLGKVMIVGATLSNNRDGGIFNGGEVTIRGSTLKDNGTRTTADIFGREVVNTGTLILAGGNSLTSPDTTSTIQNVGSMTVNA